MSSAAPHTARDGLARIGWALLGRALHWLAMPPGWLQRQIARGSAACLARAYGRRPRTESR